MVNTRFNQLNERRRIGHERPAIDVTMRHDAPQIGVSQ
jgi:hypothetical protein